MNPRLTTQQMHKNSKKAPLTVKKVFFEDMSFRMLTEPRWVKSQFEMQHIHIKDNETRQLSPQKLNINKILQVTHKQPRMVKSVFEQYDIMKLTLDIEEQPESIHLQTKQTPVSLPPSSGMRRRSPIVSLHNSPVSKSYNNIKLKSLVGYKQLD
ncbi:hypothetical protein SS50377_23810 [Spironucleus salmonicida]|uniref:Uncharacterized protein n=1 Tax=Spironucleus salmonicida TaxID=348837 RepID=V6M039_9EUKA|nr:hypothetical protein SS50377_23810 [Spironucleus salmonicida]|eukprot:EST46489.1 Hypothetical protein SS50377_13570 [Spironucleus salmonicida]